MYNATMAAFSPYAQIFEVVDRNICLTGNLVSLFRQRSSQDRQSNLFHVVDLLWEQVFVREVYIGSSSILFLFIRILYQFLQIRSRQEI